MYQFEVNDLVICKPERCEGNQEFEIYARVVEVKENKIKLDKYQRNGAFSCSSDRYLPLDECENLYRPMNDKEVLLFYTGLDSLPRWKKSAETDNTIECVQEKATEILARPILCVKEKGETKPTYIPVFVQDVVGMDKSDIKIELKMVL